jgi:formylglycine-generating enzyme required for sulfatase activity
MVLLSALPEAFCVDATEVTAEQYQAFLDTSPDPSALGPPCEWKASLEPRVSGNNCVDQHYDPAYRPHHPVVCVDWCDARAFCAWAGKRLCGAMGGGPNDFDAYDDHTQSEWYYACSAAGARVFPYGNNYVEAACVGDDFDTVQGNGADPDVYALPVRSADGCEGGFDGLFDLSGNVWEWVDACQSEGAPEDDPCRDRGGSFWDLSVDLQCASPSALHHTRSYFNKNIGFRCCASPVQ